MKSGEISPKSQGYRKISVNTVIAREGASGKERMFIILSGKARMYTDYRKPNQVMVSELTPGHFFGEMSLFLNKPWTSTVVAASDMTVFELTKETAPDFFARAPFITFRIMQFLCKKISGEQDETSDPSVPMPLPDQAETGDQSPGQPPDQPAGQPAQTTDPGPVPISSVTGVPPGLFPEGHKGYLLPDVERDRSILFNKSFSCPICRENFMFPIARQYKLRKQSTDYDMRTIYKGISMNHYYAISCPKCLFSSAASVFEKASNGKAAEIINKGKELKPFVNIGPDVMDADGIFARLYMALVFMPLAFRDTAAYNAQLWLNISWMYRDCGDDVMEKFAMERALAAHLKVYSEVHLDGRTVQRICMTIGELHYKLGDHVNARKFFFEAKTNKDGLSEFTVMAEDRIDELRNKPSNGGSGR